MLVFLMTKNTDGKNGWYPCQYNESLNWLLSVGLVEIVYDELEEMARKLKGIKTKSNIYYDSLIFLYDEAIKGM